MRETIFQFNTLISGTQRHQKFFCGRHGIEVVSSRGLGSSPSLFLLWKSGTIISLCLLGLTFYLKIFLSDFRESVYCRKKINSVKSKIAYREILNCFTECNLRRNLFFFLSQGKMKNEEKKLIFEFCGFQVSVNTNQSVICHQKKSSNERTVECETVRLYCPPLFSARIHWEINQSDNSCKGSLLGKLSGWSGTSKYLHGIVNK